ncbi:hypothetical protein SOM22_06430 [Stenotrophomonas rhizophila]|uniref:hypothetical protein n=1 Tax=Stenotrophomonas rhizophila TaxID=216778 RepID=UPI002A6B5895|nr:hypothetical protein [Stenotrophomonas rhizophila]MDY0954207.1 hypothetical protein [Stenotrophomonas rhizophila]
MFQAIARASLASSLAVTDRLDQYELSFSVAPGTPDVSAYLLDLLSAMDGISSRDEFEFHVTLDGDHKAVVASGATEISEISAHLAGHSMFSDMEVRVVVRKHWVDGALSIYDMGAFGEYLVKAQVSKLLDLLWQRFNGALVFECYGLKQEFGTTIIRFVPWLKGRRTSPEQYDAEVRRAEFSAFRDNTHAVGLKSSFLPSDMWLVGASPDPSIQAFFDRACAALCVMFLSNSSELSKSNELEYKIIGYRSILGLAELGPLVHSLAALYKIYTWAYSSGGSADKIGLARNVISLHVSALQDLRDDGVVWNAIQSNYQIYLKGNIAAYLDVKSRIAELLVDTSAKAHSAAQGLVAAFKSGVALVTTFVLGVVVVNGVKDSGLSGFFSLPYLYVLGVIVAVLSFWLRHEVVGADEALKNSEGAVRDVLHGGFSKVLHEAEIEGALAPIVKRNHDYLSAEVCRVWRFWRLLCVSVLLFFVVGWLVWGGPARNTTQQWASAVGDAKYFGSDAVNGCFWPNIPTIFPSTPSEGH